jgi:cysteine-rich repeat protein
MVPRSWPCVLALTACNTAPANEDTTTTGAATSTGPAATDPSSPTTGSGATTAQTGGSGTGGISTTTPTTSGDGDTSTISAASVTTEAPDTGSSTGALHTCGDGVVDADEACDDGNAIAYDGCEATCQLTLRTVHTGTTHVCVHLGTGAVRCWGENTDGQLGYGHTQDLGDEPGELPTPDLDIGGPVAELAVGHHHNCARLETGAVRCWGRGTAGELGLGAADNIGDDPGEMPPPDVPVGGNVIQLALGLRHSCALLDTGKLRCWGANGFGQLGLGHTQNLGDQPGELPTPDLPFTEVTRIFPGYNSLCVLRGAGEVHCFGRDGGGNLGFYSPGFDNLGDEPGELPSPAVLLGGPVVRLSSGQGTNFAEMDDGTVRIFGQGDFGIRGSGDLKPLPAKEGDMPPPDLPIGGKVVQVSSLGWHACALMDDGHVRCWGQNGGIGSGDGEDRGDQPGEMPPPDVALPGTVRQISAGLSFSCAAMTNGDLRCWGLNLFGQLGQGDTKDVGITDLPDSVGPIPYL